MPDWIPYTSILDPWIWLSLGVVLLALELFLPGYFLMAFGLSAVFIAAGAAVTPNWILTGSPWELPFLLCLWATFGFFIWLLLAKVLRATKDKKDINDFSARVSTKTPPTPMDETTDSHQT